MRQREATGAVGPQTGLAAITGPASGGACYAATFVVGVVRPHAAPWTMTNHTPAA